MMNFRKTLYLLSLSFFIGGTVIQCKKDKQEENIETEKVTFKKEGELKIFKKDSTLIHQIDIEIADNEYERQTGLMYRESMKEDQGMLFVFEDEEPRYFYMKNTLIPLDIVYLNKNREIVSISKNAVPGDETSLPSNFPAQYVLELNAGLADKWDIEIGNTIEINKK